MVTSLYEKFYEKSDLKEIRNTLDCDDDVTLEITRLIREQSAKFTDYLNFFEFVAFLSKSGQLNYGEIDDLFGYYLDCLARRPGIGIIYVRMVTNCLITCLTKQAEKENEAVFIRLWHP